MSYEQINDRPPRQLHAWSTCYRDEPVKGAKTVTVNIWIPLEVLRAGTMADYIEKHMGWSVHRHGGWGGSGLLDSPDGLTAVYVTVRAREIRAALANPA